MMKEIMRLDDAGKIAFTRSILDAEEINYVVSDDGAAGAGVALQARILVQNDDFDRATELLINAGFKHEIYPMKKPDAMNDR